MNRRLIGGLGIAIAMLAVGPSSAGAHETAWASELEIQETAHDCEPNDICDYRASGVLNSPAARCEAGRRVDLFAKYFRPSEENEVFRRLDVDQTSLNGAFGVRGSFPKSITTEAGEYFFDVIELRAPKRNIGRNEHRHICRADTAQDFPLG